MIHTVCIHGVAIRYAPVVHAAVLGIYNNPQMETNFIWKWGLPIWEYSSLPAHFRMVLITIWKQ